MLQRILLITIYLLLIIKIKLSLLKIFELVWIYHL
jgi:hypothetical protein